MGRLRYWLILATTITFSLFGFLFLLATAYEWYFARSNPDYFQSFDYLAFTNFMNRLAIVPSLLLIILLILCLEIRSADLKRSILFSSFTIVVSLVLFYFFGGKTAVGSVVALVSGYQLYLFVKLILSRSIEAGQKLPKAGSLILHTGFSLLILSWVSLNEHPYQLPVFWLATFLSVAGSIFSFFGSWIVKKLKA